MRTIVKLAYTASALVMVACGSGDGDSAMSDELRKDLQLASASESITLAGADQNGALQVVSAIERTKPPAPRKVAASQRAPRHRPAPRVAEPVEVEEADVSEEIETQPVEIAAAPIEPATLPSPRPRPVLVSNGGGVYDGDRGGIDRGQVLGGIITVVLRGGGVDGDNCDLHNGRGRGRGRSGGGGMIAINNRFPVNNRFPPIQGTFPGRIRF